MNGQNLSQHDETFNSAATLLLWAKERSNYVRKPEFTAVRVKDALNFGLNSYGFSENGELFEASWASISKFAPKTIEIGQNAQAFNEFVENLQKDYVVGAAQYLNTLSCVQVVELSQQILDNLIILLQNGTKLTLFEIFCVEEMMLNDGNGGNESFAKLLNVLKTKDKLKAIGFQYPMSVTQTQEWVAALRFNTRIIRFNGTNGFALSGVMRIRDQLPCVELLALQSFDRKLVDADIAKGEDQVEISKFFRRIGYVFCNLKMLFMDWNIVDYVCLYHDQTAEVCKYVQELYKNMKFQFVAILMYTPDDDMKMSAAKIHDYFEIANRADGLVVRMQEFSVNPETPPNFTILFFGEYHYQLRTQRMVEIVAGQRVTKPDLRHFCYIVDGDNLLNPDVTLEFAGVDKNAVLKRYNESRENNEQFNALTAETLAKQFPEDEGLCA